MASLFEKIELFEVGFDHFVPCSLFFQNPNFELEFVSVLLRVYIRYRLRMRNRCEFDEIHVRFEALV